MRIITILSLLLLKTNNKLTNEFRMVDTKTKIDTQDTVVSDITGNIKSIATRNIASGSISSLTRSKPRWSASHPKGTLIWSSAALTGKVIMKGTTQATKYNEAYKSLITYVRTTYDHHVRKVFEIKDRSKGIKILTKPSAPTIRNIIQEVISGDGSVLKGVKHTVLNKNIKLFIKYQMDYKQQILPKVNSTRVQKKL